MTPSTPGGAADPNPQPSPTPLDINPRHTALAFVVAKVLKEHAAAIDRDLRDGAPDVFERGEDFRVKSPSDRSVYLGLVNTTDPKAEAIVTDRAAVDEWFLEEHPDRCEPREELIATPATVEATLRKYVPQDVLDGMFRTTVRPPEHEVKAVLTRSAAAGEPVGPDGELGEHAPPGIEVRQKKSTVAVALAPGAVEYVMNLIRQGLVSTDLPPGITPAAIDAA